MRRFLLAATLASLLFLGIGTAWFSSDQIFWFASASGDMQALRFLLGDILLIQLLTRPPRSLGFRIFAGAIAGAVGVGDFIITYYSHASLLDTFSIAAAVAAIGLTALELDPSALPSDAYKKKAKAASEGV